MRELVFHRAEVLSNEAQKYTSTEISGGGSYVYAANGVVSGGTRDIQSQSTIHEDQSLWVRDLDTGREINLQLSDVGFRARPGHILTIAADPSSGAWERLVNESTGESSDGSGMFNRKAAQRFLNKRNEGFFIGFLLLIPLVNLIAGLVALMGSVCHPIEYGGRKVPGVGIRFIREIGTGLLAFIGAYAWIPFSQSSPTFAFVIFAAACGSAIMYGRCWREALAATANVCIDRATLFDNELAAFRQTIPDRQQRSV